MIEFTVYDKNGKILRDGCCQDSDFDYQANNNEGIIEGRFSPNDYHIINGLPEILPPIIKPIGEDRFNCMVRINQQASDKILNLYPQYKQANMTARAIELIALGEIGGTEWIAIQTAWDWVKSIRAASNESSFRVSLAVSASEIRAIESEYIINLGKL